MNKLEIEMVPSSTWGINLRAVLTQSQWDKLRKKFFKKADNKCEICGASGTMEGHEIWSYNDTTHVQSLEGIICLCKKCHMVKHFGRTQLVGKEKIALDQLMKVNKWTYVEAKKHHADKTAEWNEREKHEWDVDVSKIKELTEE